MLDRNSCLLPGVPAASHFSSAFPFQHINPVAASLIQKMLQTDPSARPTIHELLNDEFFTSGYIPTRLPITCLTIPPRFSIAPSSLDPSSRKPLTVLNKDVENPLPDRPREKEEPEVRETNEAIECHLSDLLQQLTSVNASKPSERRLVRQGECYRGLHTWGRQGSSVRRALMRARAHMIFALPVSYRSKSR